MAATDDEPFRRRARLTWAALIKNVYEPDDTLALKRWEEGERDMLFLLKGVTAQQIRACADAGEFMPQKATYLFPKLPAGAVIHRLK